MAHIGKMGLTETRDDTACQTQAASSLAPWQRFLKTWGLLFAFAGFVVFFKASPFGRVFTTLAATLWFIAFGGYALYLRYQ
jgi:hypothetical protein